MARTGMTNVIAYLRQLTSVGTSDYSIAGVSFWTDDQLQNLLDRNREDVFSERLEAVPTETGGTTYYYDYYCTPAIYEEGTAAFQVTNSLGNAQSPDSINYQMGHISFGTVDQGGSAYYLSARRFDINRAAAELFRAKAANVAAYYDFSADGHSMSRSQMVKHFQEMARMYASQAKPLTVQMRRGDCDH